MGTGIPVPPVIPEGSKAFTICVPDDPFFYGVVMGLLKQATFKYYWSGDAAQVEAVTDRMLTMYYGYQDQAGCMDCEQIADCIENDEATRDALTRWYETTFNPSEGGQEIPQDYADTNQYGAALGCDNNNGWGHIRDGLVNRSFDRVQNVLERIEFVTDNQEMLAEFLNAIPGVGAFFDVIPVTDWVLWFDNVRAVLKDAFESGDTTDLRDQVACDLFCIWQINCSLSVEQIRRYYWTKTVDILPSWEGAFDSFSALGAALAQLTSISVAEQAVYALVGSQYGFLTYLNDWFGVHIASTKNDLALGDPSDDWMALCETCPEEWESYVDFEVSDYAFTVPDLGEYTPSVGFEDTYFAVGGGYRGLGIALSLASPALINYGEMIFEYTAGTLVASGDNTAAILNEASGYLLRVLTPTVPVSPETGTDEQTFNTINVSLTCGIGGGGIPSDPGGTCTLKALRLRGTGTKPPELP